MDAVLKHELKRIKSSVRSWGILYIIVAIPLGVPVLRGLATKSWEAALPLFLVAVLGPSSLGRYKQDVKNGLIPGIFALPIEPWDIVRARALLSLTISLAVGALNAFVLWYVGRAVGNGGVSITPAIVAAALAGGVGSALISPSVWIKNVGVKMVSAFAMIVALIGSFLFISPLDATLLAWAIGALLLGAGALCGLNLKKEGIG